MATVEYAHLSTRPVKKDGPGKVDILYAAILLFCFVAAYFPVLKALVHVWSTSDDYSHGFFILPISFYIIWKNSEALSKVHLQPSPWGLPLVILILAVYFLSQVAGIQTLSSLTMIPLWAAIIYYLFGLPMLRAVAFPLGFLLFMIPIPSQIYSSLTVPLQLVVSRVSVMLTSAIGVPIFAEGNILHLPKNTLEIVEACSGLRSLLSLFVLTLVFGYFSLKSNVLRAILFLSAVPIAIFVNIVRVSSIIIFFYFYNINLTDGPLHTWIGISTFFIALTVIFIEKRILSNWDQHIKEK